MGATDFLLSEDLLVDLEVAEERGLSLCPFFGEAGEEVVGLPVPFAAGLLAVSLELTDFLRSVDNVAAPGIRSRKQANLNAGGPHPLALS